MPSSKGILNDATYCIHSSIEKHSRAWYVGAYRIHTCHIFTWAAMPTQSKNFFVHCPHFLNALRSAYKYTDLLYLLNTRLTPFS